jgi:two-component system NtrC family sensor kinase
MRLGTKLTLYLSLIIILVLSGYGYLDILSRRDLLVTKMKTGVRSTGRTLEALLEDSSPAQVKRIRRLAEAMSAYERTLGIIVYYQEGNLILHSPSLREGVEPYLGPIKKSIRENRPQESFGAYKEIPVFSYALPLKDRTGKNIGGISILHETIFMEKEIQKAKSRIYITIFVLVAGTGVLVLLGTRKWVTRPISKLMDGVRSLSKGNLNHQIDLKGGDELSRLAHAFNQMTGDLRKARERIIREAETRLELERNLRQSEKLAAVGQLASGLAHEMGTPLNIIYGRADLAKRKLEDREAIQKNLDVIVQQSERITKILEQLLGFVRKKKPEQKPLNVCMILETTLDLLDHQLRKQKVGVVKDLRENLPPVMGDPDQLQQVFLNLLLNAIQSMPKGGTLHLSASSKTISKEGLKEGQRPYMEICVEDTGIGMEREIIENIFNPFFTTKDTGTGLGLMVTQGIIQDHEGWVDVASEIGKGSVFKVYLPSLEGA